MAFDGADRHRLVVFVCVHGAVRSRLAAALFNEVAPDGWRAASVGLEPQLELGETAQRLLAGTSAAPFLDTGPPRALDLAATAHLTVAIDCQVAGAENWRLRNREIGQPLLEELRRRVLPLAARAARSPT
ncbi:MAG TPA: hypothetical protein VKF14_16800 [Candidatus Dormibacteraeota bacterium]|nr:hypothetical protein [Candidatus Dormibacteraeota bacterium]